MTISYTVYNSVTGEILRTGTAMTVAQAQLQGSSPGTSVVTVGSDPVIEKIEVSNPGPVPRGPINVSGVNAAASKTTLLANGTDSVTISPLPNGATYNIAVPADQGINQIPDGTVTDGSLVITTTVKGTYVITIKFQTYQDLSVTLNAN